MKKLFLGLFGAACVAGLTGCINIHSSDGGNMTIYPQTKGPVDNYRPLYTVDNTKRVTGRAQVNVLFGIFTWGDNNSFADNASIAGNWFSALFPDGQKLSSQAAFYNACKSANCDAVVAARYEVRSEDYWVFSKCTAEVRGFPAVQTSVETIKPFPYYIDAQGKLVVLESFITPVKLFDERPAEAKPKSSSIF